MSSRRIHLTPKSPLSVQFDDASSDGMSEADNGMEAKRFLRKTKSTSKLSDTRDLVDFLRTTGPEDSTRQVADPHTAGSFFRRPSTPAKRDPLTSRRGMSSLTLDEDAKKSSTPSSTFWKKPKIAAFFGRKQEDHLDTSHYRDSIQPAPKVAAVFPSAQTYTIPTGERYTALEIDYNQCLGEQFHRFHEPVPVSLDGRLEYMDKHMLPPLSSQGAPAIPNRTSSHSGSSSDRSSQHKRRSSALADTIVQSVHRGHTSRHARLESFDKVLARPRSQPLNGIDAFENLTEGSNQLSSGSNRSSEGGAPRISKMRPVSIDLLENIVLMNQWGQEVPRQTIANDLTTLDDKNANEIAPLKIEKKGSTTSEFKVSKLATTNTRRFSTDITKDRPPTHLLIEENKLEEYIKQYSSGGMTEEAMTKETAVADQRISDGSRIFASDLSLSGYLPSEEELTDMALRQRLASFESDIKDVDTEGTSSASLARTSTLGSTLSFPPRKGSLQGAASLRRKADKGMAERLAKLLNDPVDENYGAGTGKPRLQPARRHVQVQTSPIPRTTSYTQTKASDYSVDESTVEAARVQEKATDTMLDATMPLGISFLDLQQPKDSPVRYQQREPKERPSSPPPRMKLPSIPPATPPQHGHTSSTSSSTQTPPITPVGPPTRDIATVMDASNPYEFLTDDVARHDVEKRGSLSEKRASLEKRTSSINTLSSSPVHSSYHTPTSEPSAFFVTDNFEQVPEEAEREEEEGGDPNGRETAASAAVSAAASAAALENQQLIHLVKHLRVQLDQERRSRQRLAAAFDDSREKYEKLSMNAYMTIQGLIKQRTLLFEEVLSTNHETKEVVDIEAQI